MEGKHAGVAGKVGRSVADRCRAPWRRSSPAACEYGGMPRPSMSHRLERRLARSEEHTSELQSLMRISYAVFCLKKQNPHNNIISTRHTIQILLLQMPLTYFTSLHLHSSVY